MASHTGTLILLILGCFFGCVVSQGVGAEASVSITGNMATVLLNANVTGNFECSIDGGPFLACMSGSTFPNISPGPHSIFVTFQPEGSSTVLTFQPLEFSISEAITATASVSVSGDSATVTVDADDSVTCWCSLDGSEPEICFSGFTYTGLSAGSHSLEVRCNSSDSTQTILLGPLVFSVSTSLITSAGALSSDGGRIITVAFTTSTSANCQCKLNMGSFVDCVSGHMFTGVPAGPQNVTVTCTSDSDPSQSDAVIILNVEFLNVQATLGFEGTTATVIIITNIGATCMCKLDDTDFVPCFDGFQYRGVSAGNHTILVQCTSVNNPSLMVTAQIDFSMGTNVITITDIQTIPDISTKNYTFFFNLNDKPDGTSISLLIDNILPPVPYWCHRLSETRCYCTFSLDGDQLSLGLHSITFQALLNGAIRGQSTSPFTVSDVAVVRFKDLRYSVVEGDLVFDVTIQKIGDTGQSLTVSIETRDGTAMTGSDFPTQVQSVTFPIGSSSEQTTTLRVLDDSIFECNETFEIAIVIPPASQDLLVTDPAADVANVTIIDDDVIFVDFSPGARSIREGGSGLLIVTASIAIGIDFTVRVETYECAGNNTATPGEDYIPFNKTFVFSTTSPLATDSIQTISDDDFEQNERICVRIVPEDSPCPLLTQPSPVSSETELIIQNDDVMRLVINCYTNTSGTSVDGRTINLFYEADSVFGSTTYRCRLNNGDFQQCERPPPTVYSSLSYGEHTVTVEGTSGINSNDRVTIIKQVLLVQGRISVINGTAMRISIQSTKNATFQCQLNDGPFVECMDGTVFANLAAPMRYTITIRATSVNDTQEQAYDIVGPVFLTGSSATTTCFGGVELMSTDGTSNYSANWRGRENRVEFQLTGITQGWVGIGFSHNRMMAQSDAIVGAADGSGNFFVTDRFATVRAEPPLDLIQNVDNGSASFINGVTTVIFSRLRDTGDSNDFSLNNCLFFLFVWGGNADISSRRIQYHGATRRMVSTDLICIPTSTTICPDKFDCGVPGTPINGDVMFTSTLEDSISMYSCSPGYALAGNSQRICQSNAQWSGSVPDCRRINCGDPGKPDNGTATVSGTFVGNMVTYSCDSGFRRVGVMQRTCLGNGSWTDDVPMCERVDCGDPGKPDNGTADFTETYVEDVVTYSCDSGFRRVGVMQRTCLQNGSWTDDVPMCERINCGDLSSPDNGIVSFPDTYFGSTATYTCNNGYVVDGDAQRMCQEDSTWTGSPPTCQPEDCGSPGLPADGNVNAPTTTLNSVANFTCNSGFTLCGDSARMCLPSGVWSGSVPECIRVRAEFSNSPYSVMEDAGFIAMTVTLDQSTCRDVTIMILPQEKTPVDASVFDFDASPSTVVIPAGQTTGIAMVAITNDDILEDTECFNVQLQSDEDDVTTGQPARVNIMDDGDEVTVSCMNPPLQVNEEDEKVTVCISMSSQAEVTVLVNAQPMEIPGSAEADIDFEPDAVAILFSPGETVSCFNQTIIDDSDSENTESFNIALDSPTPNVVIGTDTCEIVILDDDGVMIMKNDTVIGDPLFTVPLYIDDEMIASNPDVANTSLCYEIHGEANKIYNLVSDQCVSITAEYEQSSSNSRLNVIGRIGVVAVDNSGNCQRITVDVDMCEATVGSQMVTSSSPYDVAGIRVRAGRRYFRIALPNCELIDLVAWVICDTEDMLKFVITRGFNLRPTSHGLVGQFWNIPVALSEFVGSTPDNLTYYTVSVTPADGDVREFVGHLYDVTWDFTPIPCIYAGNRNGGKVSEFTTPNDPVVEGKYDQYEVGSLFDTQFIYTQFEDDKCSDPTS